MNISVLAWIMAGVVVIAILILVKVSIIPFLKKLLNL